MSKISVANLPQVSTVHVHTHIPTFFGDFLVSLNVPNDVYVILNKRQNGLLDFTIVRFLQLTLQEKPIPDSFRTFVASAMGGNKELTGETIRWLEESREEHLSAFQGWLQHLWLKVFNRYGMKLSTMDSYVEWRVKKYIEAWAADWINQCAGDAGCYLEWDDLIREFDVHNLNVGKIWMEKWKMLDGEGQVVPGKHLEDNGFKPECGLINIVKGPRGCRWPLDQQGRWKNRG